MVFKFLQRLNAISRLSLVPPEPSPSRFGVAIVAIVKNESRYIVEWAEFHLKAGVKHLYIYDNGSTDETCAMLRAALHQEQLTIIPWEQTVELLFPKNVSIHNQVLAYAHAASNFGRNYRWMAFIDVDEFIIPKKHHSIVEALDELPLHHNISLPWHMFGTSGHKSPPEASVVNSYRLRYRLLNEADKSMMNFKCIVDPCKLTGVRVHSMQTMGEWVTCNDRGKEVRVSDRGKAGFYSSELLQLNHYYTRSEEEFLNKIQKGHVLNKRSKRYQKKLPKVLEKIDSDVVEDLLAINYLKKIRHDIK